MSRLPKWLYALLLASAVLAVLLLLQPVEEAAPGAADELLAERPAGTAGPGPQLAWSRVPAAVPATAGSGGFAHPVAVRSAAVPARVAAPVVVAPPATPQVPEPAFSYLGRLVDGDRLLVFLAHEGETRAVPVGATVAEHWRIDSIAAGSIGLTYLPLGVTRQLALGDR